MRGKRVYGRPFVNLNRFYLIDASNRIHGDINDIVVISRSSSSKIFNRLFFPDARRSDFDLNRLSTSGRAVQMASQGINPRRTSKRQTKS
jgi:hypothetical protein